MKTTCKDCGESKVRQRSTRKRQVNRFYYVDENEKLWNGLQCPKCKIGVASGVKKEKVSKGRNLEGQPNAFDEVLDIDDAYIYC